MPILKFNGRRVFSKIKIPHLAMPMGVDKFILPRLKSSENALYIGTVDVNGYLGGFLINLAVQKVILALIFLHLIMTAQYNFTS
ncbi:hypothetical protein [Campylobacter sp. 19-13652]|uniref:hypothetical protein n=1 Tax=Campylobacter sp. 19-13652 TaxID=2840180 RepID=UPI001C785588|nr:hypothetical protein [Campylobacter sp. 19-13652]BCX80031.1 hypothetical protein LBC_14930 [Campylobacter sp. 19-13652]